MVTMIKYYELNFPVYVNKDPQFFPPIIFARDLKFLEILHQSTLIFLNLSPLAESVNRRV